MQKLHVLAIGIILVLLLMYLLDGVNTVESSEKIVEIVPLEDTVASVPPKEESKIIVGIFVSEEDIDLIALFTMAEAENQDDLGKRMVMDTIINRVNAAGYWADNVYDVVYQPGQYSSMWNGRINKCIVKDDIRRLVLEEVRNISYPQLLYFRTGRYSSYGTPYAKHGDHYFSTL